MMISRHYERLHESLEVIDECVSKGAVERQRTIGFSCSAAAVDMLEIYLHQQRLIEMGFILKHDWFKSSNKLDEKLNFDFKSKARILDIMRAIEEKRNGLCYGIPKQEKEVSHVLKLFNDLKDLFRKQGVEVE